MHGSGSNRIVVSAVLLLAGLQFRTNLNLVAALRQRGGNSTSKVLVDGISRIHLRRRRLAQRSLLSTIRNEQQLSARIVSVTITAVEHLKVDSNCVSRLQPCCRCSYVRTPHP